MIGLDRRRAVIVGGGTAGTAAAVRLAHEGHSVLILERTCGDGWRAGETLPPVAGEALRALGVWERFLADGHRPSRRTVVAWGESELRTDHHLFNPYGSGWHIDRGRFDEMLAATAEKAGARRRRCARVIGVEPDHEGFRVAVSTSGGRAVEQCDWLVDATGRGAALARLLGESWIDDDRTIGMVGRLAPVSTHTPVEEALLVESAEQGWWYSAELPDGMLVAAYLTDPEEGAGAVCGRWHSALASTSHTVERTCGFVFTGLHVCRASTGGLARAAGAGWVAVGDAALAHDPLSGQGLVHALATGMRGAAALCGDRTDVYAVQAAAWRNAYLRQRSEVYRREKRWTASPFWRRRQAIDPQREPVTPDPRP